MPPRIPTGTTPGTGCSVPGVVGEPAAGRWSRARRYLTPPEASVMEHRATVLPSMRTSPGQVPTRYP